VGLNQEVRTQQVSYQGHRMRSRIAGAAFLATVMAMLVGVGSFAAGQGQPPKPAPNPAPVAPSKRVPSPRFRGHVTPKNIDMLRRMSYQRNQGRLQAMKAVAPPAT